MNITGEQVVYPICLYIMLRQASETRLKDPTSAIVRFDFFFLIRETGQRAVFI